MAERRKILIVDDEVHIVELLSMSLRQNGYDTCSASEGKGGLEAALIEQPDLILLDLMLPGLSGLELCRRLRADPRSATVPVIMLTAKSEESDKVIGLGIGADDYVTKPFSLRELLARIEATLRRAERNGASEQAFLRTGSLEVNVAGHTARLGSTILSLSPSEFFLLAELAAQPGIAVRREVLTRSASVSQDSESGRSLDVHVRKLRMKLENSGSSSVRIETVRGVGYRLRT